MGPLFATGVLVGLFVFGACQLRSDDGPVPPGAPYGQQVAVGVCPAAPSLAGDPAADSTAVLPRYRVVAYYGNPLSQRMGILALQPPDSMFARLERQAAAYAAADPSTPVRRALHLVAVVAQQDGGRDGMYRNRMPADVIGMLAGWAEARGYLLFLDVQLGRSTVEAELDYLLPFLERPYVHLALDPEFAMAPGQAPGSVIGSLDASDVNTAIRRLADVVVRDSLPPKMLIIHRFTQRMLTGVEAIRLDPGVQVVVDMDGIGSKELKRVSYRRCVHDEPVQFAGIKLFYELDHPLFTPEEVLRLNPVPNVIIYQ